MAKYTQKAIDIGINSMTIRGSRWTDSVGNTYHKVSVDAVIGKYWERIAGSEVLNYGGMDMYIVTACKSLIDAGLIEAENEYALSKRSVRESLNIEIDVRDVRRQKDM